MKALVHIKRFNPAVDREPYLQTFEYDFEQYMTVLDVLGQIAAKQEPSLCFMYCCRSGHCGLCAVMVNGKPYLTCRKMAEPDMRLEPLASFPVKRDLLTDRQGHEEAVKKMHLFLERETVPEEGIEAIDMSRYPQFLAASRCVECLCCTAGCPVWRKNPYAFAGPTAFTLAARLFYDSRDTHKRALMCLGAGMEKCTRCGLCSSLCPQNANPAASIADMLTAL